MKIGDTVKPKESKTKRIFSVIGYNGGTNYRLQCGDKFMNDYEENLILIKKKK